MKDQAESNEIVYSFRDCYELQLIDCNCNNCFFMERDMEKFYKWEAYHRAESLIIFEREKAKEIADAQKVIDTAENEMELRNGKGLMRVAEKMKYQFEKKWLIQYGNCLKFNKLVSFTPVTCQIETQTCFLHRKDAIKQSQ